MFRSRVLLATVALLSCLVGVGGASPAPTRGPVRFVDLAKLPRPQVTGQEITDGLQQFVTDYRVRQALLPNNDAAARFLAGEARGYGFTTKIIELEAGTPSRTVKIVQAVKKGSVKPSEWIMFVAHYDIANPAFTGVTVEGAYDNGAGANLLRYFAKVFSKVRTKRSIAIVWPGDEDTTGFVSTTAYARLLAERGQKIAGVLGFDMAGLNYPAPYCMCIYHGASNTETAMPIIEHVNFDFLEFPKGDGGTNLDALWPVASSAHVCSCGPAVGSYGEAPFAAAGYPTYRWHGMRGPGDYPFWHTPLDTFAAMEQVAGGRSNLDDGMLNTLLSGYYTALMLDAQ